MAGKFFHTVPPQTLTDIRLTLLTQIDIFWEKRTFLKKDRAAKAQIVFRAGRIGLYVF